METSRARSLLEAERLEVQRMLADVTTAGNAEQDTARGTGDAADSASPLIAEGVDHALAADLQERLDAIDRAEKRLADGTFGLSVRSRTPIPDERLEVMPTAELTVQEATEEP